MVPTMPPLFLPGRKIILGQKTKNKVDRHIIGNSLPLMLLNFQRKFWNFFETALDAIGSFESIMSLEAAIKGEWVRRLVVLLIILIPSLEKDNRILLKS